MRGRHHAVQVSEPEPRGHLEVSRIDVPVATPGDVVAGIAVATPQGVAKIQAEKPLVLLGEPAGAPSGTPLKNSLVIAGSGSASSLT